MGVQMVSDKSPAHINEAVKEISEGAKRATEADVRRVMEIEDAVTYLKDDTYTADPSVALGQVFVTRAGEKKGTPFVFPIDVTIKPSTKLPAPLVRGEIIVDQSASVGIDVLSIASLDLSGKDVAELHIIDNYAARIDTGAGWRAAVREWRDFPEVKDVLDDPTVQSVSVVVGIVQKYVTVKKYTEYSGNASVNAYGVNVEGKLFTSTSSFRLEIVYGLSLVDLLRVSTDAKSSTVLPAVDLDGLQFVNKWARSVERPIYMLAKAKGR